MASEEAVKDKPNQGEIGTL